MCNEYAREIALARCREELAKAKQMPFEWQDARTDGPRRRRSSPQVR